MFSDSRFYGFLIGGRKNESLRGLFFKMLNAKQLFYHCIKKDAGYVCHTK